MAIDTIAFTHTQIVGYQILPRYIHHMKENPDSLLCKYLGLYKMKPEKRYLVVMANVLSDTREMHKVL